MSKTLYQSLHQNYSKTKPPITRGELSVSAKALWQEIQAVSEERAPSYDSFPIEHLFPRKEDGSFAQTNLIGQSLSTLAAQAIRKGSEKNPSPHDSITPMSEGSLSFLLSGITTLSLPFILLLESIANAYGIEQHPPLHQLFDQECRDHADRVWRQKEEAGLSKKALGNMLKATQLRMGGATNKQMGELLAAYRGTPYSTQSIKLWNDETN